MDQQIFITPNGDHLCVSDDDFITGRISMSLSDIVKASVEGEGTVEGFLDAVSLELTGTILLTDIEYRAVGFDTDECKIILEITGCISFINHPSDDDFDDDFEDVES